MKLSPQLRVALKRAIRKWPPYQAARAADRISDCATWTVERLADYASSHGITITATGVSLPTTEFFPVQNSGETTMARSAAAAAFASDPLPPEVDAGRDAAVQKGDADALVRQVLAPMGSGDMAGFQRQLQRLAALASTPEVKTVEKIVEVEVEKIVEVERVVDRVIERIVEVDASPAGCRPSHIPSVIGTTEVEGVQLDKFDAPDAPTIDPHYVWPAGTRVGLSKVKRGQVTFLTGPAGTGKTTWAEQVAALTGRPFVRISCHSDTTAGTLVGGFVSDGQGGFRWGDGILLKAIRRPGTVVLIDEPSAARPDAMMILQGVLEPRGGVTVDETGERVRVARGVSFVLADNTNGTGDVTGAYEGTRRMNRATLDRCAATLVIDYLPADREAQVIVNRAGVSQTIADKLVNYANLTRQDAAKGTVTHGVGLRRLLAWAESIADGIPAREGFETSVLNTAAHDDKERLQQIYVIAFNASKGA